MPPTQVFFRDDDVTELTPALELVSELLSRERVPCNYALVPERLTPQAVSYMCALRRHHPSLVRLNQHGNTHQRSDAEGRVQTDEFGGGRPAADQLLALRTGRERLAAELGSDFDATVFTPPCHKYDENTLAALDSLGFEILSASVHTDWSRRAVTGIGHVLRRNTLLGRRLSYHGESIPGCGLIEVSVAIDVDEDRDRNGEKRIKTAAELCREFERARSQQEIVGVMLHHPTYRVESKIEPLREFVGWLVAQPDVELQTIEQLGASLRPRPAMAPALEPAEELAP